VATKYDSAMARRGSALAVVVAVALIAACSGSDDAAPVTTLEAPTTVVTTVPDPTTTVAPTTEAPTTTVDPAEALAAEVEADYREADHLGREALMDPFDATKEAAALDRRLGVIAENFAAKLADWRDSNYALRENPDVPASITVEVPATLVLAGGDVAEMQICEVDTWVIVEVGAGPNGGNAVVDDEVISYRTTIFMRNDGDSWRIEGGNETGRWEGADECLGG
jgi:hypothetical protein